MFLATLGVSVLLGRLGRGRAFLAIPSAIALIVVASRVLLARGRRLDLPGAVAPPRGVGVPPWHGGLGTGRPRDGHATGEALLPADRRGGRARAGPRGACHTTARGLARHREPDPRVAGDAGPRGGPRAEARRGRRRGRPSPASTAPLGRRRDARRPPTGPPIPAAAVDVGRIDPVLPPLLLPLPPLLASRGRAIPTPRRARRVPRAVRRCVHRGDAALGAPRDEPAPLPARCAHGDDGAARALPRGVRRADGRVHVRDPPARSGSPRWCGSRGAPTARGRR